MSVAQSNHGPLDGVRILDLTSVVMGPYATQVLADLGADVIKIEPPTGDILRHVGPMRNPQMGHLFLNANRNKRSVVLDLKRPAARRAVLRLAQTVDVFVHNIRPVAMARLGLGYQEIAAVNPRIIYAEAIGYGSGGPYSGKPAYDDLIQGEAGLSFAFSELGREPGYVPSTIADRSVGLYLANAISAALFYRERSGEGQQLEVPMYEVFTQFVLGDHLGGLTFEPSVGNPYYSRLVSRHRHPYQTKDGHICVLLYNDTHWERFFSLIGKEDVFRADTRFATHSARSSNIDFVYSFVKDAMCTRTTAEWMQALGEVDIPASALNSVEMLLDDEHLKKVGFFQMMEHPSEGLLRVMDVPSKWSKCAPSVRMHAPRLGEHTSEVLAEAGIEENPDEVASHAPPPG
jgi:crotonobetainyl-CoA:carnitine CoA-transferase CaiB-like acyl-CoA transferase